MFVPTTIIIIITIAVTIAITNAEAGNREEEVNSLVGGFYR